ncbi:predicted protein [Sclerotinia sclerotiorum 1980 UF-70]|uniref:Uncharacterized protein n=1 Tax=Sclerotinia sclerotiorum (strain ATCC 18683 / 1980 / Ss-1) TaxID=665079 RepID=A7EAC0_SCLS1|nr:predicted protein [Sclerotinia sclerotiorum 1980 UF-70]EDN99398.1 predicted protein [Sclerotinia sclerotiorum 1980 UF-70]
MNSFVEHMIRGFLRDVGKFPLIKLGNSGCFCCTSETISSCLYAINFSLVPSFCAQSPLLGVHYGPLVMQAITEGTTRIWNYSMGHITIESKLMVWRFSVMQSADKNEEASSPPERMLLGNNPLGTIQTCFTASNGYNRSSLFRRLTRSGSLGSPSSKPIMAAATVNTTGNHKKHREY